MSEPKDLQRYEAVIPWEGEMQPHGDGEYVRYDDIAPFVADIRSQLAAAERERDAYERELHDESVMLHTALLGRNCAEPGAVSACHPMVCDCGTPYEDATHRDLCEAVRELRHRAERMGRALERIIGMCDVPPTCTACGRPNGLPAVVMCAKSALDEPCECFYCADKYGDGERAFKEITRAVMRGEPIPDEYTNALHPEAASRDEHE